MSAPEKTHPFWIFSLALYARAGIEPACLALQESGADVNLLLLCCWLGSAGRQLDSSALERLRRAASPWQTEVVSPLRRARRAVKSGIAGTTPEWGEELRRGILAAELDAEYLEQTFLADLALPLATMARKNERALPRSISGATSGCSPSMPRPAATPRRCWRLARIVPVRPGQSSFQFRYEPEG